MSAVFSSPESGLFVRQQFLSRGAQPAILRHFLEGARRLRVHRHHGVMEWRVRVLFAVIDAALVVWTMLTGVPTAAREVEPATEGELPIDHDDLLMLRCSDCVMIVVAHPDAPPRPPSESIDR